MRLLKLYESGLPSWAVFLPSYGAPYRPWFRHVTWALFVLVSLVSMACGFYDLYRNVPYIKEVRTAVCLQCSLWHTSVLRNQEIQQNVPFIKEVRMQQTELFHARALRSFLCNQATVSAACRMPSLTPVAVSCH